MDKSRCWRVHMLFVGVPEKVLSNKMFPEKTMTGLRLPCCNSTRAVSGMHRQCLRCAGSNDHQSSSLCDDARENGARSSNPRDHHTNICVGPTNSTVWSRPYQIEHCYQPARVQSLSTTTGHIRKQACQLGHRDSRTDGNRKRGDRDTRHDTPPPPLLWRAGLCANNVGQNMGGGVDSCKNDARRAIPFIRPRACVSCFTGSEWSSQRRVTCHIERVVGMRCIIGPCGGLVNYCSTVDYLLYQYVEKTKQTTTRNKTPGNSAKLIQIQKSPAAGSVNEVYIIRVRSALFHAPGSITRRRLNGLRIYIYTWTIN